MDVKGGERDGAAPQGKRMGFYGWFLLCSFFESSWTGKDMSVTGRERVKGDRGQTQQTQQARREFK